MNPNKLGRRSGIEVSAPTPIRLSKKGMAANEKSADANGKNAAVVLVKDSTVRKRPLMYIQCNIKN